MIANVSAAFASYEDTLNTLKYADRAKQIKTVVRRNVLNVDFHIANYTRIIQQLREEIQNLRGQIQQGSNRLRQAKIDVTGWFEKEVMVKKEVIEVDRRNEELAFRLFSKQMEAQKYKGST